jgi:hypothetical protein
MGSGYDTTCTGDLFTGKCYVNVHTPSGCDPAVPPCSVHKQEIIGYTDGGEPISKGKSDKPWMAWIPQLTTLNQDGTAYQPYSGGIPYTLEGGSVVKWNPTDMQALAYLDSAPGAQAAKTYQERTCNPLWSNVFGCKEGDQIWVHNEAVTEFEEGGGEGFWAKLKSLFGAESESEMNPLVFVGIGSALIIGCIMVSKA